MGLVVGLDFCGICQGVTKAGRYSLARQAVLLLYAILSIEATTDPKVSGCASTLVEVLLYGCPVGEGYVRVKSYDAIPNGSVDMSEIAVFSETIGTCSGDPKFNSCYDFNGDSCIDLSDIALFSGHDGHSHPVAPPED